MEKEKRFFEGEIQSKEGKIYGYAAVFGKRSLDLGGFTEEIDPDAFSDVLNDDVVVVVDHDTRNLIGRTISGTAKIGVDQRGLYYEVQVPKSRADIFELIERGDIRGSSFQFTISGDQWKEEQDGSWHRTVTKVKRLYDVGPVVHPAYPDTTAAMRSLHDAQKIVIKNTTGLRAARLRLIDNGIIIL